MKDFRPRGEDDPFQALRGQLVIPILKGFTMSIAFNALTQLSISIAGPYSASF
jgi:hypothetical protein